MITTIAAGPSVPSGLMALRHGGDVGSQIAEGAKNLWVRTGHQWNMTLGTYNVRSLKTDDRLMELEHELEHITWDIIGLSEVRRRGIGYMTLKSGHQFYHSGNDSSQAGVGFLINKALAGNVIEKKGSVKEFASWFSNSTRNARSMLCKYTHRHPHMKMK